MRAGDLDRRVRIEKLTKAQDPNTGEQVETWATLGTVWMGKRDMRANERWAANQVVAELATVFTARWSPAFDVIGPDTHRLVYRDRVFEIHGVREIGRHEGVEIATAARAEGAG